MRHHFTLTQREILYFQLVGYYIGYVDLRAIVTRYFSFKVPISTGYEDMEFRKFGLDKLDYSLSIISILATLLLHVTLQYLQVVHTYIHTYMYLYLV